jgi:hypothetical protein
MTLISSKPNSFVLFFSLVILLLNTLILLSSLLIVFSYWTQ